MNEGGRGHGEAWKGCMKHAQGPHHRKKNVQRQNDKQRIIATQCATRRQAERYLHVVRVTPFVRANGNCHSRRATQVKLYVPSPLRAGTAKKMGRKRIKSLFTREGIYTGRLLPRYMIERTDNGCVRLIPSVILKICLKVACRLTPINPAKADTSVLSYQHSSMPK